jgi:hypothetical protein
VSHTDVPLKQDFSGEAFSASVTNKGFVFSVNFKSMFSQGQSQIESLRTDLTFKMYLLIC